MKTDLEEYQQAINGHMVSKIPRLLDDANYSTAERRRVAQLIRKSLSTAEILDWCVHWSLNSKTSRKLACSLIGACYPNFYDEVFQLLLRLADDQDWGVREEVTWSIAEVLEKDFEKVCKVIGAWASHPSPNIRRAIVVASQRVGKSRNPKFADSLFKLLEPLLSDRNSYVKKNLGPFALGDGLINYYPEIAFRYLNDWLSSPDEQVRWNIAMSMSSTAGFARPREALVFLEKLSSDQRKYVQRGVITALRRLGSKHPSIVCQALTEWCHDLAKSQVAETAINLICVK